MKKTILLVEDSKVQKLASERILFKAGYLVLFAGDGEEARFVWLGKAFLTWFCWTCYCPGSERRDPAHTQARSAHRADSGDCRQPSSANQFRPAEGGRSGGLS